MFAFGVGAAIPLLALGLFSRDAMLRCFFLVTRCCGGDNECCWQGRI
jgi:hypothetical protein